MHASPMVESTPIDPFSRFALVAERCCRSLEKESGLMEVLAKAGLDGTYAAWPLVPLG